MEIHKPHAAKTWKEFFIELGTIVAGILIAIALEQTVDYFRHVDQLHIVRGELAAEIEENQEIAESNASSFAKIRAALAGDIAILRVSQAKMNRLGENLIILGNLPAHKTVPGRLAGRVEHWR